MYLHEREVIKCLQYKKGKLKRELSYYNISKEVVEMKLKNWNPNKSPGPGKLHTRILKELQLTIDKELVVLFQIWKIPDKWKHAKVTAIFKKEGNQAPTDQWV